jgi:hypothetical protein
MTFEHSVDELTCAKGWVVISTWAEFFTSSRALTAYLRSICTSLRCATWKGRLPRLVHSFLIRTGEVASLAARAGTGGEVKFKVICFNGGGAHTSIKVLQILRYESVPGEIVRKTCARIGACERTAPSQTSSSWICSCVRLAAWLSMRP